MTTYTAPTIPPAPQPQPLGASPTAEQVTAFQAAMNLYLRREEFLALLTTAQRAMPI